MLLLMQNSIYKIKYLLFLSWDWKAWCLTQPPPPPTKETLLEIGGGNFFHCLGAPNNLIRPSVENVGYWTWKGLAQKIAWASWKSTASINCFLYLLPPRLFPSEGLRFFFEPNLFTYVQYPTFSTAVTLHTYSPVKMEQTVCSETLVFNIE
jgi:hypothetical protein